MRPRRKYVTALFAAMSALAAGTAWTQDMEVSTAPAPVVVEMTALDVRAKRENEWRSGGLLILPYRPNYILPYAQNFNGNFSPDLPNPESLDDVEAKFQISLRMPVARGLFFGYGGLQLAYTQLSLWQVYNRQISSPFRETVYEPEAMLTFDTRWNLGGWTFRYWYFGINHQSNGKSDPASRSWNRLFAEAQAGYRNTMVSLRPWLRVERSGKEDDNPDIEKYMGNFELRLASQWRDCVGSVMWRNNLREENKGAVELSFTFPMFKLVRGMVQYFNGYGETLIDYNHPVSRLGVGLTFSDWL